VCYHIPVGIKMEPKTILFSNLPSRRRSMGWITVTAIIYSLSFLECSSRSQTRAQSDVFPSEEFRLEVETTTEFECIGLDPG